MRVYVHTMAGKVSGQNEVFNEFCKYSHMQKNLKVIFMYFIDIKDRN